MSIKWLNLLLIIGLLYCSSNIFAQTTQKTDNTLPDSTDTSTTETVPTTTAKTSVELLEVTIDKIEGDVEAKKVDEKEWITAVTGMKLKEGSKVSTGFKSKAVLLFADNSTVVIKPLTQLTINRFNQDGNEVRTKLGLRIGAVQVKVKENQPVKTDMKIYTPNATASVRGTDIQEIKTSLHFGDTIAVDSGKVRYSNKKSSMMVQGGESTDQNLIHPIENALMQIVASVAPIGITDLENRTIIISVPLKVNLTSDATSENSNPVLKRVEAQEQPISISPPCAGGDKGIGY